MTDDPHWFADERMANAYYWAAQADAWLTDGPNAGLEGRYTVEVLAGKPTIVLDDSFNAETTAALVNGLREYGFPSPIRTRELEAETRVFISEPSDDRLYVDLDPEWRAFGVRP